MLPCFVQLPTFTAEWDRLGMTDRALGQLERELVADPAVGVVVKGTDGWLRKVRVKRPGKGKSGGLRVFYTHLPGVGLFLLGTVIDKAEQADLGVKEAERLARAMRRLADHYHQS